MKGLDDQNRPMCKVIQQVIRNQEDEVAMEQYKIIEL